MMIWLHHGSIGGGQQRHFVSAEKVLESSRNQLSVTGPKCSSDHVGRGRSLPSEIRTPMMCKLRKQEVPSMGKVGRRMRFRIQNDRWWTYSLPHPQ
jgi:hypothetical protein